MFIVFPLLAFLMFMNIATTDYRGETTNYFMKTGQADRLDYILPKTTSELRAEKVSKDKLVEELLANVTRLSAQMKNLRRDVNDLKMPQEKTKSVKSVEMSEQSTSSTEATTLEEPKRKKKKKKQAAGNADANSTTIDLGANSTIVERSRK
jgi:hypothetical protein